MKRSSSLPAIVLFLACCCAVSLHAQQTPAPAHSLRFIHYNISDGLPSNSINCLAPDKDGFLWIGTLTGLARWNGHHIDPFNQLATDTKLPEGYIKLLYVDSHNFLWVKFLRSPGLYRVNLSTLQVKLFDDEFYNSREGFPPRAFEDANGNVWLSTARGLSCYNWEKQQMQFFPLEYGGDKNQTIQACRRPNGQIWVGTGSGLFLFHPENGQYEYVYLFPDDRRQHLVESDEEGHLWIGRWYDDDHGVLEFDPDSRKVLRVFAKNGDPGGFLSTEIAYIFPDGNRIWFGCNEGGGVILDKNTNRFSTIRPDETDPSGILDWNVGCIAKDKFGNYWLGTNASLDLLPNTDKTADLLAHNPYRPQSLVNSKANTTLSLPNGDMVFGTNKGLSIYDPVGNTWRNVQMPVHSRTPYNNIVVSLASNDANSFWAGTWEGVYLIDSRSGGVLKDYFQAISTTHRMFTDSEGILWTTYNSGQVIRYRNGNFETIDTLTNDGNADNERSMCFAEPDKRYILIGTVDGITRFDRTQNRYEALPIRFPGLEKAAKVVAICITHDQKAYVIASNRIFRIDLSREPLGAEAVDLHFPLNNCLDLIEDNQGDVWVCAESGLVRITPGGGNPFFFDARNFLRGNTFYPTWLFGVCAKGADGRLYFAGISGVSVLRPEALKANSAPPSAVIIGLKINNQTPSLDSVIQHTSRLRLSSWQNNLSFEFSALCSALPELNRYAYRLIPANIWNKAKEGDWVDIGQQNSVNFSNLSPGDYRLELRVANSDGIWCDQPATLHITIRPPWYRSVWAYLLYALLIGGGAWLFYRYQWQIRVKQAETEHWKALDSFKTRFFTNITHEFRTPLTVILGMTEQAKKHFAAREEAAHLRSMDMIRRNGQDLLYLINQILDLSKLESGKLQLNIEKADIIAFARYIVESFHSFAVTQNIQLHFLPETESIVMDFDREKIQTILANLLSNAIKFTPQGGNVYLHIGQVMEDGRPFCRVKVRDTGIGIPAEEIDHVFERFYQAENAVTQTGKGTGIGLALTKELVKLMNGNISVTNAGGALFTVNIPIQTQAVAAKSTTDVNIPFLERRPAAPAASVIENDSDKPLLLIVEDNHDVRQYLVDCVVGSYQVAEAFNGREGIEKAYELIPDLIVSDVMMPEKDGFELCQTLKNDERSSHIPLVLLTAKADVKSRIEGLTRGADEYIAKPFNREELLVRLQNLLENRRRLQLRYASLPLPPPSEDPELKLEDAFLIKIREAVEKRLSDADFEMPQLERAMHMSRSQIFRKVKALTGRSPSLFIRSIRLDKAASLLRDTDMTIAQIAYEVGFNSPAYFSTAFMEEFGKSPSEVRV